MTTTSWSRRETAWFMLAALGFIALEIAAMGAWVMVTKPFWLDEVSTWLVAGTGSLPESIRSLAAGADSNPPTGFILYRLGALVGGGLSPITARIVAAACVVGALTTVYLLLRDQFSPWPAAIGTTAVWAQQVVMHAAFDARLYGPLLFASGCMLVALLRTARQQPTLVSSVSLALVSVVLCTIHYFGILTWGIAIGTVVLFGPGPWTATVRRLLPSIAGPLALVACAPLYLGQRASLTLATWMPDLSALGAVRLLATFFLTLPLAVALCCWAIIVVRDRTAGRFVERVMGGPLTRPLALGPLLLLTQAAVAFVLVAFSLLVQPATELRYWIAGTVAVAPVAAFVFSRGDPLLRWVATFAMVAASVKTMWGEAHRADAFARRVQEDTRDATQLSRSGTLIVTRLRDTLYPVLQQRPELNGHMAALDATPLDSTNRFFVFERDLGRINQRLYGFGKLVTPAELNRLSSFYFIEPQGGGAPTTEEFPRHTIRHASGRVYYLVLRSSHEP